MVKVHLQSESGSERSPSTFGKHVEEAAKHLVDSYVRSDMVIGVVRLPALRWLFLVCKRAVSYELAQANAPHPSVGHLQPGTEESLAVCRVGQTRV